MRVMLLMGSFVPGGMANVCMDLARYLRRAGHDVCLLVDGPCVVSICDEDIACHIHVSRFPRGGLRHALGLARPVRRLAPDVLFLNHAFGLHPLFASLPRRTRIVPVLHTDYEQAYRATLANSRNWNVAVAVSPGIREKALQYAGGRPVVCIPNGIAACPPELLKADRVPHSQSPFDICYVGRLVESPKNLFLVPHVLRDLREHGVRFRFTFIGDGEDRSELERRVASVGLSAEIHFTGAVPPGEVYSHLLRSHVLLFPSVFEGFGLALAEAESCGCVPVASRLTGVTDFVVHDGHTGILVDQQEPGGYARAITRLYRDPAEWTKMSNAGPAWVDARFSVAAMGQGYEALLADLLADRYPLPGGAHSLCPVDPAALLGRNGVFRRLVRRFSSLVHCQ